MNKKAATQMPLIPEEPITRLAKHRTTTPQRKDSGKILKVTVVTERFDGASPEGEEIWTVIETHAVFQGATAEGQADRAMALLARGAARNADNRCVADGVNLARLGKLPGCFAACMFPGESEQPAETASAGGGSKPLSPPANGAAAHPTPTRRRARRLPATPGDRLI